MGCGATTRCCTSTEPTEDPSTGKKCQPKPRKKNSKEKPEIVVQAWRALDWRANFHENQAVLCWKRVGEYFVWHECWISSVDCERACISVTPKIEVSDSESVGSKSEDIWQYSLTSADVQPALSERGISLAHLRRFVEDVQRGCEGKVDPREFLDRERTQPNPGFKHALDIYTLPWWLVVDMFVRPATRKRKVPFVDIMAAKWQDLGGPKTATHFVSHAWEQCFVEDVECLEHFGDDAWFWISVFAVTQDDERGEPYAELIVDTLEADTIQQHVLLLDATLQAFTRGWVLYELSRAYASKKELIILPSEVLTDGQLLACDIDPLSSSCTKSKDWTFVCTEFEEVGIDAVSNNIRLMILFTIEKTLLQQLDRAGEEGTLMLLSSLLEVAEAFKMLGDDEEAAELGRRALQGYEQHCGPKDTNTLSCMSTVAGLVPQETQEAEDLFRGALEISEQVLGPEHQDTLMCVNHLADFLHEQGNYDEAVSLYQRALLIREALLGPEHMDTLTSVSNLAGLLQDQGHHFEAEPLYRRALQGFEELLGPEHDDTLTSVNHLALFLRDQGRHREAEPLYQRALLIREALLGPEHPDTLTSVNNLAGLMQDQGRYEEAEALYQRASEGFEEQLGLEHPDTLTIISNLAGLLDAQGQDEEAEPLYRRVIQEREEYFGFDHPETLATVNNLAGLLWDQGRNDEAQELYWRVLEGREEHLGPEHIDTLMSVNILAGLLQDQGNFQEAESLYRRALAGRESELGPEHPDTLTTASNLALLLKDQGQYQDAEPLCRRALHGYENQLGPEHPDTLTSVNNLAELLFAEGQYDEAEFLFKRSLRGQEA